MELAIQAKRCRLCQSPKLDTLFSLGDQFVPDFIASGGDNPKAPLELVRCLDCGLVQLRHTFSRDSLYRHYWYRSGISATMREALADIVSNGCRIASPNKGDMVVDIGCNDGTLLRSYKVNGVFLVGFEPAKNLVPEATVGTNRIINDFFTAAKFKTIFGHAKVKIVTSIAMFYDLEEPNRFVADVAEVLAPDGIWIIQQNYLATMLEKNGFDNIGHEHLEYYSLATLKKLLDRHGLVVFDVQTNEVNGGSFRTYISRPGAYPITESVIQLERYEASLGLERRAIYNAFARNIQQIRSRIHEFIGSEVGKGKTVYVYGASNRGNTILQYCGLDHNLISKATDANPEKWGREIVGTEIPIISKEQARKERPDYFLILPHHFLGEILQEEQRYLASGGKFIVPLPKFRIVGRGDLAGTKDN